MNIRYESSYRPNRRFLAHADHKYVRKEKKNGKWVYYYAISDKATGRNNRQSNTGTVYRKATGDNNSKYGEYVSVNKDHYYTYNKSNNLFSRKSSYTVGHPLRDDEKKTYTIYNEGKIERAAKKAKESVSKSMKKTVSSIKSSVSKGVSALKNLFSKVKAKVYNETPSVTNSYIRKKKR